MQIHFGLDTLHAEWSESVVVIGTFDGVHLGHAAVIAEAVERAHLKEIPCCLVTFDRHPASVVHPDRCPTSIASLTSNLDRFKQLGVSLAVILPFTTDLMQTPAQDFYEQILVGRLRAGVIVVGHDFAFGHDREGTPEWLRQRTETIVLPPFRIDNHRVSSSEIRAAISEGRIEHANRLLGRPFQIEGVVVAGQRLGRTLGYPTINLARSFAQTLPPDGVYAAVAETAQGRYAAALAIGTRPAVGGGPRSIEAYLLDYSGASLYGTEVTLKLLAMLRPEKNFVSLDALKAQMALDVEQVRAFGNG